ncbi:MAG: DUF3090 family protein [Candidatus Rokuibacteriota bacterium]
MSDSFDLPAPDHFTAGALGRPGQRTFYLQGREAGTLVTLKVEKEHVGALGEYLAGLLAKLAAVEAPGSATDLLEPVVPAWPVSSIAVGYDESRDRVLIAASEQVEEDSEAEGAEAEGAVARFHVTREQAAGFVARARALMEAGRPTCPMCSRPRDPSGHVCPRANGHAAGHA